jgi:hypothetical protein
VLAAAEIRVQSSERLPAADCRLRVRHRPTCACGLLPATDGTSGRINDSSGGSGGGVFRPARSPTYLDSGPGRYPTIEDDDDLASSVTHSPGNEGPDG